MYRMYSVISKHAEELQRSAGNQSPEIENYNRAKREMLDSIYQKRMEQALVDRITNEVVKRIRIEIKGDIPNIKEMIEKGLGL